MELGIENDTFVLYSSPGVQFSSSYVMLYDSPASSAIFSQS